MKQSVFFMAGFPRAGSTLLMNILGQNPKFHPTPTSGLIASILNIRDSWNKNEIYQSNDPDYISPKISTMLKNMILGFYEKEIDQGKIPIDKNRAWVAKIDLLEELFGYKIKIIYPMRNIIEILESFEKINRKSNLVNRANQNDNWVGEETVEGRARNVMMDGSVGGISVIRFRELMYRDLKDRLVLIPYNNLLYYPDETLSKLHDDFGLKRFKYDLNNIKQITKESDIFHGYEQGMLHDIREGKLEPLVPNQIIFSQPFINEINKAYADVHNFINTNEFGIVI